MKKIVLIIILISFINLPALYFDAGYGMGYGKGGEHIQSSQRIVWSKCYNT